MHLRVLRTLPVSVSVASPPQNGQGSRSVSAVIVRLSLSNPIGDGPATCDPLCRPSGRPFARSLRRRTRHRRGASVVRTSRRRLLVLGGAVVALSLAATPIPICTALALPAFALTSAKVPRVVRCEFVAVLAMGLLLAGHAPLGGAVADVIRLRADEKVRWVDASRGVAAM